MADSRPPVSRSAPPAPREDGELLDAYSKAVIGIVERVGPAAAAGLAEGDVVVGFDGEAMRSVDDLHRALNRWPIPGGLEIRVVRDGALRTLEVSPREAS